MHELLKTGFGLEVGVLLPLSTTRSALQPLGVPFLPLATIVRERVVRMEGSKCQQLERI